MMKTFVRPLVAASLAWALLFSPALLTYAQDAPAAPAPAQNAAATTVSLGVSKYHYTRAPKPFPNLLAPYTPIKVEPFAMTNSPRIGQMIQDGKLNLSLQDAVELALQNNLDIVVFRYNPWLADTGILKAQAGGVGGVPPGALFAGSTANSPFLNFDPTITSAFSIDDRSIPVNNPLTSGTGTGQSALAALRLHTSTFNTQFTQGFHTGTTLFTSWDNTRSSSTSPANLFNPSVQSSIFVGFQQQLLNGFGIGVNTRNIRIAKNNRKIADLSFAQQAITTVTNTITAYWELVYARENVKVQQQAVTVAEKLYNDNKKQLEIGTMAPLDVTRAESELATDRQNLIVAQTAELQQQQVLKNAITKDPLAANVVNLEIIPTDLPSKPEAIEAPSFEQAVSEAFAKRPDVQEMAINLLNGQIDLKATRNALLPTATLQAQYGSVGLAGNQTQVLTSQTVQGTQLIDGAGNKINAFVPITLPLTTQVVKGGLGDAMSSVFHNNFPDYSVSLNLTVPIRNRSAQADNQRAILTQRQIEAQMQQLKNSALLDVRNTYIALEQNRARVDAAAKARELQQQTFDAEQKKYQLGASTVYLVIQTQRDLIAAQGTELRALTDLVEAKANYERALGRTLEVNRVSIADAKTGRVEQATLIPGTINGQVVGMEKVYRDIESHNTPQTDSKAGER
ncbi:MAG: TolC family protein [Acidobacteria bacterium]|nr:TolC family protein [Acidobacteriota bacterium]MBS1865838.1 TolC family protein [Acidobacteriota bacterium]